MIIIHMNRMVDNISVPMARASILWLIGENSPSLLDIINIALFISTHKDINIPGLENPLVSSYL